MLNRNRQYGFTLVEVGIALLLLIFLSLIALYIVKQMPGGGGGPATGTTFTVRGDWVQAPIVIAKNQHGKLIYKEEISGTGVPGITIRYEIEGSNYVTIISTLDNESSSYDISVTPAVETTKGEITTDSSGEAVLTLSALSDGTVKVTAFVIDHAGNEHKEPEVKKIEIETDPTAQTQYP